MELVEGASLAARLKEGGPLDPADVVHAGSQLARALSCAHRSSIVHRDVKPANALRAAADGTVKLMDFGLVRLAESSLTREGQYLGSPHFSSPEQIRGAAVDARSDLFSLALTLYTLATGRNPFTRPTIQETARSIVQDDVPPASRLRPDLGSAWDEFFARALAKEPAARFADAAELEQACLGLMAAGAPVLAAAPASGVPSAGGGEGEAYELVVVSGPDAGLRLPLAPAAAVEVGRGKGDLALGDATVSSRHCRIERAPAGSVRLIDHGSSNGTWLDGARVTETELQPGQMVTLGSSTRLRLEARRPSDAEAAAPNPPPTAAGTVLEAQPAGSRTAELRPLAGAPRFVLVVREGPAAGQRFPVGRSLVLGRDEGDICLDDPKISRKHAVVELRGAARLTLRDLASANGTWLGAERVREVELRPGDEFRLGSTVIALEVVSA
jgi:pSer/pThr/pTyr-binding forkhead associated (FHA) protein